jgi:DNA-binding response OmpR family regulator
MGLDIGADDYIVKPFSPGEVMARVRAVVRRAVKPEGPKMQVLFLRRPLHRSGGLCGQHRRDEVALTKKEMEILWTLATNQNKVFSAINLLNSLWGLRLFLGTTARWIPTSSACGPSWYAFDHEGWEIKPSGVWATNSRLKQMKNNIAFS